MHDSTKQVFPETKSYTSAYDLTGASEVKKPFCGKNHTVRHIEDLLIFQSLNEVALDKRSTINNSEILNETNYVTSERYHKLNKKSSDKSVIRSTSTFFYDLDSLVKRHSYHCITDISEGNKNTKPKNKDIVKNFKSEAIVQECATQLKPKLLTVKNFKEKKKVYKSFPNDSLLSSEIFLRDNEGAYPSYKSPSVEKCLNERHQKFWSFAKYRTEHTNPVSNEKKVKKKDRGKRTEDPCPCQLFSYACPCTNTKSLTELAKNSKSLTVADEVTSTPDVFSEDNKCNKHKVKKLKDMTAYENKRTSTIDIISKQSKEILSSESPNRKVNSNMLRKQSEVVANNVKIKSLKKTRQVLCPNCKEMIDVMSTTEEEESLKSKSSPLYRDNELPTTPAYTYQDSKDKSKIVESRDTCNHEPQCELVPVCQILPTDNIYVNQHTNNKSSTLKPTPRVIRVTKGCRHHPPCTVVPSCQRVNVLNNNCEYIPPCLHRPRCVNLPLCAPLSKSIYYDETIGKPEEDLGHTECLHMHHARCMPTHQNESIENQITRVQNTCEYLSECSPRFVLNSTLGCISPLTSPCQPLSRPICKNCKSEKSCQYDFLDWKQNVTTPVKKSFSDEDVIFIRDVGCQFRNKNYSPKDSLIRYKASSDSFNMNVDRYCANYHTLRYEDKFTIPISGEEQSVSTVTLSSTEIDSQCPTHGRHNRNSQKGRTTGFVPKATISPFVAYTNAYQTANFCLSANDNFKQKLQNKNPTLSASMNMKKRQNAILVKSRSSFLKGKYKNILRRKTKSRTNHQQSTNYGASKKMVHQV